MERGDPVTAIGGPFGVVATLDANRFEEELVRDGEVGSYCFPHPNPRLEEEGWHMLAYNFERNGERVLLYCPLHEGQFKSE